MRALFSRRGQNLLDLALIISVAGLVFVGMQTYVKRGVQGKVKDLTDYIVSGKQTVSGTAMESAMVSDSTMRRQSFPGGSTNLTGTEDTTSTYKQ